MQLKGKNILIGVCGGIALYKIPDLIRQLRRLGAQVKVIMTPFAKEFVGEITFKTLTGNPVYVDWSLDPLAHINLARWADVFLIAPCTVNTLSKIALGIGDNLLTTTVLAYKGPLIIAPAANTVMLKNPSVQENLQKLKERGITVIDPEYGILACEEEGEGKLASVERLLDWIFWALEEKTWKGIDVLVTCGSTREYIDPVRFISNDSSGKMGFALARVLRWKGANVKLIAGHTTAKEPPEIPITRVRTSKEMFEKVSEEFKNAKVIFMNAAVSDYRPVKTENHKIKKTKDRILLELQRTEDILSYLGKHKGDKIVVGFALETQNLIENARRKLLEKNIDLIVANPPTAMGSDAYEGYLITSEGVEEFSFPSKEEGARFIVERVEKKLLQAT